MKVYTIGFTQKKADAFFGLLEGSAVKRVIDVRLNNVSQLAGFAKKPDLEYFLNRLVQADYIHEPMLAPTKEMLDDYKKKVTNWDQYEEQFMNLITDRKIEKNVDPELVDGSCLLCSEHQPECCHRRLVAEYLNDHWGKVEIEHLS